jgi:hypothetical protein
MSFFNGMDAEERDGLYELINALIEKLDTQRRLNEDLSRRLAASDERFRVLGIVHYGLI